MSSAHWLTPDQTYKTIQTYCHKLEGFRRWPVGERLPCARLNSSCQDPGSSLMWHFHVKTVHVAHNLIFNFYELCDEYRTEQLITVVYEEMNRWPWHGLFLRWECGCCWSRTQWRMSDPAGGGVSVSLPSDGGACGPLGAAIRAPSLVNIKEPESTRN